MLLGSTAYPVARCSSCPVTTRSRPLRRTTGTLRRRPISTSSSVRLPPTPDLKVEGSVIEGHPVDGLVEAGSKGGLLVVGSVGAGAELQPAPHSPGRIATGAFAACALLIGREYGIRNR